MGKQRKKPDGKNNQDDKESIRKTDPGVTERLQQMQMRDLGGDRLTNLLEADFPENYHEVDQEALDKNRAVNKVGSAEWSQGQKDKDKLDAWGTAYKDLADDGTADNSGNALGDGQYHRNNLAAAIAAAKKEQDEHEYNRRGIAPPSRGDRGRGGRGGGAAGGRGRGDRQLRLSTRPSRSVPSSPTPTRFSAQNSRQPHVAARNPEVNRPRGRGASRGNLTRRNWHPPVASYVHTFPRGRARGRTPLTTPSSATQPIQPQAVTPVQVQSPQNWAPRGLATPEIFLSGYATILGENTARAGATLSQNRDVSKDASKTSDSGQAATAVEASDGSEKSQVLTDTDDSARIITAANPLDDSEKFQAAKDNNDSASLYTAVETTKGSESPEALIDTDNVNEDTNRPTDILFSEEMDEAPIGLRVLTPPQTTRDSYTNDLLGLELQPENQAKTEATEGQGSQSNLDNNANDLRQGNAQPNMTEVQARLVQLSILLPTLAPADAMARLMALTTLFDADAVVPPAYQAPPQGQDGGQASNNALKVNKDEVVSEEASDGAPRASNTEKIETVAETTSAGSGSRRESSQGATGHQNVNITSDPRVTHALSAHSYASAVAETRRNEWTSNVVVRQEVILGRPPMSGNLQHSEHYPGVYVPPKDKDVFYDEKKEDRIFGEHNRAIGHPGSVPQDQQITDESQNSSVKEADSDELADKLSQLQLGGEGVALVNPFETSSPVATTSSAQVEQSLSSATADASRLRSQDDAQPLQNPFEPQRVEEVRPPVGPAHRPTRVTNSLRTQSTHRPLEVPQIQATGVRLQGDRATTTTRVNDPFFGSLASPNFRMRSTPSFPDNAITRQYTQRPRPFDMSLLETITTPNTGWNPMVEHQNLDLQASTTQDLRSSRYAARATETVRSVSPSTTPEIQVTEAPDNIPRPPEPVGQPTPVHPQFRFAPQNTEAYQFSIRQRRARGRVIPQYPPTRGHRLPHEFEPSMASYRRPTIQQLAAWLEADLAIQTSNDAGLAVRAQYAGSPAGSYQPRTPITSTPSRWSDRSTRVPASSTFAQTDAGAAARLQYGGTLRTGSNLQTTTGASSPNRGTQLSPRAPVFNVPTISDPGAAARAQYGGTAYRGPSPTSPTGRGPVTDTRQDQTPTRVAVIAPIAEAEEAPVPSNKDPWSQARNRQL